MHMYVNCSTVYNSTDLKPTKCLSVIDWIKKMWQTYTMEYYTVIKKDEFMSFAGTWMNLETIIGGSEPPWHVYTYVINLQYLHMFLRT